MTAFWHDNIETLPRPALENVQERRLLRMLRDCFDSSPLLQELWGAAGIRPQDIRSLADFQARAPFMDKDVLRRFRDRHGDPYAGLARGDDPRLRIVTTTSGTTGDATPLPFSGRPVSEIAYPRYYHALGVRSGDYLLQATFTFRLGHQHSSALEAGLIPIVVDHGPEAVPRIVEASLRFRPTVFSIMSTPLMIAFEEYFEKHAVDARDVFSSYKVVIFGGEALAERQRALAASWGIELFELMALGDVSTALECPMHDGCHPHEDLAFVECLDPEGAAPVPDGQVGELVVTMLADPLLPLIRFRTDDLMIVDRSPCGCGRTQLRYRMMGRKSDQVVVDGRSILPIAVRPLIDTELPSRAGLFQVIKPAGVLDRLYLRVGHDPAALDEPGDRYATRLQAKIAAALGIDVAIELVANAELLKLGPPHKIPRIARQ